MPYLLFLASFTCSSIRPNPYALAPPPINFTHEEFESEGEKYDLDFDKETLKLSVNKHNEDGHAGGVLLAIVAGLFFWMWVFFHIFGKNVLINTLIVILSAGLSFHIFNTFFRRKK